ncbi:ComF family protein [Actinomycetospora sp. CA-084318]|uniref:ComF family protein n=1 Tax=Actinomycetospora sp. CA-084318 TaxID=3239892 RepID=UPI003D982BC2
MITAAWRALLDLLLPTPCGGCDAVVEPGRGLCAACRAELARPVPTPELPGLPPALALAPYAGGPRRAVIAYKERGRRDLAGPLAAALAAALDQALPRGPCVLVPAPSRPGAARARGGDHMLRLARAVAAGTEHVVLPALALSWRARDSVGLDARERAANLAAHLRVRRRGGPGGAGGRPVVLLDDVLTTGATARTCAGVLAAAGLPVDLVLVITAVGARRPVVPGGRPTRTSVTRTGATGSVSIRRAQESRGVRPTRETPARHLPATRRSR